MRKDLVPQKRVASELGVSRSTLWRAIRSNIAGFPTPFVLRSRVYWRKDELPALKDALDRFEGRRAFEAMRRHERARVAVAEAASVRKPPRKRASTPALPQPDLFGAADAAAPVGAEAVTVRRYRDSGP